MNQPLLFAAVAVVVGALFVLVLGAMVAAYLVTHRSVPQSARAALLNLVFRMPLAVVALLLGSGGAVAAAAHFLGWPGPSG